MEPLPLKLLGPEPLPEAGPRQLVEINVRRQGLLVVHRCRFVAVLEDPADVEGAAPGLPY